MKTIFSILLVIPYFLGLSQTKEIILTTYPQIVPEGTVWLVKSEKPTLCEFSFNPNEMGSLCSATLYGEKKYLIGVFEGERPNIVQNNLILSDWKKAPYTNDETYSITLKKDNNEIFLPGEKVFLSGCLKSLTITEMIASKSELENYKNLKQKKTKELAFKKYTDDKDRAEREEKQKQEQIKNVRSAKYNINNLENKNITYQGGKSDYEIIINYLSDLSKKETVSEISIKGEIKIEVNENGEVYAISTTLPDGASLTNNIIQKIDFEELKKRKYTIGYREGVSVPYYDLIKINYNSLSVKQYDYKLKSEKIKSLSKEPEYKFYGVQEKLDKLSLKLTEEGTYSVNILESNEKSYKDSQGTSKNPVIFFEILDVSKK